MEQFFIEIFILTAYLINQSGEAYWKIFRLLLIITYNSYVVKVDFKRKKNKFITRINKTIYKCKTFVPYFKCLTKRGKHLEKKTNKQKLGKKFIHS